LVLFYGGDQLALPHAARSGDAELLSDLLQVGNEQLREVTDRTALWPRHGDNGSFRADGRLAGEGFPGRGGRRVTEEFGGVAH